MTEDLIDLIANDGCRNAAGGIYSTRVYEFANAIEAEATAPLLARIAELEAQIAAVAPAVDAQPVALLSQVAKLKRYNANAKRGFATYGRSTWTINVPGELLDRIDTLLSETARSPDDA